MIQLRVLHPEFAAEVEGLDLRVAPDAATNEAVEDAIARYPVLVLHGQDLTNEQQIAFLSAFGDLQESVEYLTEKGDRRLPRLMTDSSNIGKDSRTFDAGDARRMNNLGSRRWHTDQSFKMRPVKYSLLCARSVAKHGGETQFADMRGAYEALPEELRERVTDLVIEHSLLNSRRNVGFTDATELEKARLASVHQRRRG